MLTFLAASVHIFLNFVQGRAILRHLSSEECGLAARVCTSVLTGIYFETLFSFILLFMGFPVLLSNYAIYTFSVIVVSLSLWKKKAALTFSRPEFRKLKPRWYEIVVTAVVLEKVILALWVIYVTPVYFDDALTHWSARGRALFGGVNWSFDPDSPLFMGFTGHKHYPLMIPVWRASTAAFAGKWNDVFARVDGTLFFVLVVITVWSAVNRFSRSRLLASVSAFLISSLPFHVWHSFSGFADIGVEVFCAASMAALLRKEWFIAGVLAAGTAWAKNDGVVLFIPPLFLTCLLIQRNFYEVITNGGRFAAGLATLFPWILFKCVYMPGIAPGKEGLVWHNDIFFRFFEIVINGPTHTVFWIFFIAIIFLSFKRMFRDLFGRAMLVFSFTSFFLVIFVFGMTDAYRFLVNEMTIHRTMLQYYGVSVMISMYAVSLSLKKQKGCFGRN